jgi:ABC-type bacteriocin/lantibiotic exporter with double-glycine peptidase domain
MTRRARAAATSAAALALALSAAAGLAWTPPTAPPVARAVAWSVGAEFLGQGGTRLQRGEVDCGIAALQMVLEGRGARGEGIDSARAAVLARGEGATLAELRALAARSGVGAEGWRMDAASLARAPLPAIAHLDGHFVVVDRVEPGGSVLARDPAIGRVRFPPGRFAELWTGNVLVFPPPDRRAKAVSDPSSETRVNAEPKSL